MSGKIKRTSINVIDNDVDCYLQDKTDLNNLIIQLEETLSQGSYKEPKIFNAVQSLMENYDAVS